MAQLNLKVNDRIEVLMDEKPYKSVIQDIGEDFININLPANYGQYLALKVNEKIEINFYDREGICFNFNCKVLERGRENNIIYYRLCEPYNIKEIQRRDFARVNILTSARYKQITGLSKDEIELKPYMEALMVDLSGGGIRFKTKEKLNKNDILMIKFMLNEQINEVKVQVIRYEETLDGEYICGVKFLDISERQREKIIREIFRVMRKQREIL